MVDQERRRLLRLVAAGALSLSGGGVLAAVRLRGDGEDGAPGAPRGPTATPSTASRPAPTDPPAPSTTAPSPSPVDAGSDEAETEVQTLSVPHSPAPVRAGLLTVICREAWGAAPPTRALPTHRIRRLTVHHTAAVLTDNRRAPDRIRNYQRFHQSKGFADLAYHYVIDARGNVYEARDVSVPGETFTDYDPTGHFLVVLDGNFDEQPVPARQLDALVQVLAWAARTHRVSPATIHGHRDYASTRCPGKALYSLLSSGQIRRRVEVRLARGGVTARRLCGPEARARVRAIRAGRA